jgi:hypothetical protein
MMVGGKALYSPFAARNKCRATVMLMIVPTILLILQQPSNGSGTLWGLSPLFIGLFTT